MQLDIYDVINIILAVSVFTLVIVTLIMFSIRRRQSKNMQALKNVQEEILVIKNTVTTIAEKQVVNETILKECTCGCSTEQAPAANEIKVEVVEEPIMAQTAESKPVQSSNSRAAELAAKIAEYSAQIDQLNEIEDVQVRDLKKQLLIFELQEIKREIALIEGE